jgi:hypothetical protein
VSVFAHFAAEDVKADGRTKNGTPVFEEETDIPFLWISYVTEPCAMNFVSFAKSCLLLTTNT